jgi:outer membrane receptor protein involved in Fe transport
LSGEDLKNMKMKIRSRVPDTASLRVTEKSQLSRKSFDGVLLINGVVSPSTSLAELSPDKIESVEVVKGAAAMKMSSDPAAVNGIISIKLKAKQ